MKTALAALEWILTAAAIITICAAVIITINYAMNY